MLHWNGASEVTTNREALQRANERQLEELADAGKLDAEMRFACECGDPDCVRLMLVTGREYERLMRQPRAAVVVPGHHRADERVVLRRRHYVVVADGPRFLRLSDAEF